MSFEAMDRNCEMIKKGFLPIMSLQTPVMGAQKKTRTELVKKEVIELQNTLMEEPSTQASGNVAGSKLSQRMGEPLIWLEKKFVRRFGRNGAITQ